LSAQPVANPTAKGAGLTDADKRGAKELIARYPHAKSALLPLLHLAQDREGWVTPRAMEDIADLLDLTPALVLGTCSFYTMLKREPVGRFVVSVCTNVSCLVNQGPDLLDALRLRYLEDDEVTVEEVECLAACDVAPVLQVNYEFHNGLGPDAAIDLVEQYKRGELTARTISGSSISTAPAPTPAKKTSTSSSTKRTGKT
jgi:NADH-quinone oxidoreductase subunit E